MRTTATITKAHNYLRIHDYHPDFIQRVIGPFCRLNTYQLGLKPNASTGRLERVIDHVFARSNHEKTEYRISSSLLKEFMDFATYRGYDTSRFNVEKEPELEGVRVHFEFNEGFDKPKPGQPEWIDYMLDEGPLKINNASTGFGKTFMAIYCMVKFGYRTVITMQPRYITTWIKELNKIVKLLPGDLVIWEHPLPRLADAFNNGTLNPKVVILPMSRVEPFLRKKDPPEEMDLDDIFKAINPGLRIIEEGHEAIHQVFSSLMYGNLKKFFVLSATLRSDDAMTNKVYGWVYPKAARLKEAEPEHYIDVVAYLYRINLRTNKIRAERFGAYDDKAFEESILKSKKLTDFYFELMDKAYQEYYVTKREAGTKCLFFFSRKNMCAAMKERFLKRYPGMDFDTFTGDDKNKTKYLEHEIVITTPNSCGTGKDIPGLITVICGHLVFSRQSNAQIIGRLRDCSKLFGGLITPMFIFTVCIDLNKHIQGMDKRFEVFAPKTKTFKRINSECCLE